MGIHVLPEGFGKTRPVDPLPLIGRADEVVGREFITLLGGATAAQTYRYRRTKRSRFCEAPKLPMGRHRAELPGSALRGSLYLLSARRRFGAGRHDFDDFTGPRINPSAW